MRMSVIAQPPRRKTHGRIDLDSPEDLQAFTLRTERALHGPVTVKA
jgi:hypothetical protein